MRNAIKGFQVSKLAVPKMMERQVNNAFGSYHRTYSGSPRMNARKPPAMQAPKPAIRPGKNAGIRGGYKVM